MCVPLFDDQFGHQYASGRIYENGAKLKVLTEGTVKRKLPQRPPQRCLDKTYQSASLSRERVILKMKTGHNIIVFRTREFYTYSIKGVTCR